MRAFFSTRNDYGLLLLRVFAGGAMLPYGLMKLGWVGEGSLQGTIAMFVNNMGIPSAIAILVIAGESLGAASLILGFCTRFCAASLAVIMAGAVYVTFGGGYMAPGGYAVPLLFLFLYLPLVFSGAGALSVDGAIAKKLGA